MIGPVLIVEDDKDVALAAQMLLVREAERIEVVADLDASAEPLRPGVYDVALLDMNFQPGRHDGAQGLDRLASIKAADPALSVVLVTAYGGVALAVEGLKQGASDFVLKPWRNEKLLAAVHAASAATRAARAEADLNLDALERAALQKALARYDGNISHAATALGLTRPALYRRLEKHGL